MGFSGQASHILYLFTCLPSVSHSLSFLLSIVFFLLSYTLIVFLDISCYIFCLFVLLHFLFVCFVTFFVCLFCYIFCLFVLLHFLFVCLFCYIFCLFVLLHFLFVCFVTFFVCLFCYIFCLFVLLHFLFVCFVSGNACLFFLTLSFYQMLSFNLALSTYFFFTTTNTFSIHCQSHLRIPHFLDEWYQW